MKKITLAVILALSLTLAPPVQAAPAGPLHPEHSVAEGEIWSWLAPVRDFVLQPFQSWRGAATTTEDGNTSPEDGTVELPEGDPAAPETVAPDGGEIGDGWDPTG